jgi:hypothetical protein
VRGHFFGQSSFATHTLATASNLVTVPKTLPLELLAPLGCGLQTGAGTVMNSLAVNRGDWPATERSPCSCTRGLPREIPGCSLLPARPGGMGSVVLAFVTGGHRSFVARRVAFLPSSRGMLGWATHGAGSALRPRVWPRIRTALASACSGNSELNEA